MKKKIVLFIILIVMGSVALPLLLSLMFSSQSDGRIVVNKPIEASYLDPTSEGGVKLVYFGYVGCTKICTPILENLDAFYRSKNMDGYRKDVEIVFVNLTPHVSPEQAVDFAKAFNPAFHGIYLNKHDLMRLDRDLGIFFSDSLTDETEINHSDFLYMIKKISDGKYKLLYIYPTHPLNENVIVKDLNTMGTD